MKVRLLGTRRSYNSSCTSLVQRQLGEVAALAQAIDPNFIKATNEIPSILNSMPTTILIDPTKFADLVKVFRVEITENEVRGSISTRLALWEALTIFEQTNILMSSLGEKIYENFSVTSSPGAGAASVRAEE